MTFDEMATIFQRVFFKFIFFNENYYVLINILLKFASKGSIDPSYKSHNASDKYPTMHHQHYVYIYIYVHYQDSTS